MPVPRPGTAWPPVHDGLAPPPPREPGLVHSSAVPVPSASPPQPWPGRPGPRAATRCFLLLPCSGARAPPCSKAAAVPGTPRLVQQRQQPGDAGARPRGLPAAAEPGSALPATRGQSPGVSPGAARQRTPSPHGRHPSSTQGTRRSSLHAGHLRELPIGTARPKASRLLETQLETRNRTSTRRIPGPDPHVCSSLIW